MLKEIYLVRHGHSDKQDENGQKLDDQTRPLSQQGAKEVYYLAGHLRKNSVHPGVIFTSSLVRAQQTAAMLSGQLDGAPIVINEHIGEANFGNLPDSKETLERVKYGYNSQAIIEAGGETVSEVEVRVGILLQELAVSWYECIVVVSHGLTLSVMSQLLQNLDRTFENIQILSTSDYSYFLVDMELKPPTTLVHKTNILRGTIQL